MSTSPNIPFPLPSRQSVLHERIERQGLALGVSRDRAFRARVLSQQNERNLQTAMDCWENEGGTAIGVSPTPKLTTGQKTNILQFSADLFRDDTLGRAVMLNAVLVLIAATILVVLFN
ncbi:TPM domain-containing protein [Sphingobium aromaticivastans]|uniref:TPM domain-containing protein n=1 Tax=Sphingobium aromaticivastans TaxID=1778665 RepID=UPI003016123E